MRLDYEKIEAACSEGHYLFPFTAFGHYHADPIFVDGYDLLYGRVRSLQPHAEIYPGSIPMAQLQRCSYDATFCQVLSKYVNHKY